MKFTSEINSGHFVAQIRLIFKARLFRNGAPLKDDNVYAYVQPFKPAPGTITTQQGGRKAHVPDDNIEMYRVCRVFNNDGTRAGMVIKVTDIWRHVELIPKFGARCPSHWDSKNAVELATEFYVNNFADKEVYQAVF